MPNFDDELGPTAADLAAIEEDEDVGNEEVLVDLAATEPDSAAAYIDPVDRAKVDAIKVQILAMNKSQKTAALKRFSDEGPRWALQAIRELEAESAEGIRAIMADIRATPPITDMGRGASVADEGFPSTRTRSAPKRLGLVHDTPEDDGRTW